MAVKDIQPQIEMFSRSLGDVTKESGSSINDKKTTSPQDNDDLNFIVSLFGFYTVRIYKPLIPLKLVLFIWYGSAAFLSPFLQVYLKQQGITLNEISTFYALSPIVQILGSVIAGIIADKLGKSKPILVVNLILVVVFLIGILFVPRLNGSNCATTPINLKCHPQQFDRLITKTSCDVVEDVIEINSCNVQCPENVTDHCDGQNLICEILAGSVEKRNFSLLISVSGSHKNKDRCYYNVSSMSHENETYSWCSVPHKMYCRVSCTVDSGINCNEDADDRRFYLIVTMILFILWSTVYSSSYRFMDVTSMALVRTHDSDFGRERFFSVAGMLVISPLAGLIADATSITGGERNFLSAFYFFIAATILLLVIIIFYLDVQIIPPGQNMLRKALHLFKNPDVISFAIVVFILGTSFSFTKNFMFWYLAGMKASSLLLGLIPAFSALYGLPFLATSGWWVKKVGPTQIFILGLLSYLVNSLGYSVLYDPWYSLILEATNIFTYHLLWVAVIEHSHELAPEGLTATMISSAGSIHYQLGKTSGALVGGQIMDAFGGRVAFRVVGIICLICAALYGCYLYIRRRCYTLKRSQ